MRKPNKPKGGRSFPMRPGDKWHLKDLALEMERTDRFNSKRDPHEEGQLRADGYEVYSQRQMRIHEDERIAAQKDRTRMENIKRKRAEPTNNVSPIGRARGMRT